MIEDKDESNDESSDEEYIGDLETLNSDEENEMIFDDSSEGEEIMEEEEGVEEDFSNIPWNWQQREIDVPSVPFDQPSGHNTRFTLENSALEIFSLFFTSTLINFIVIATNLHAQQIIGTFEIGSSVRTRLEHDWYPITAEELMAFMGIYLLAGLVQMKSWKDYFVQDDYGYTHNPVMFRTFSEGRWKLIKRFLYFEIDSELNNDNKLAKIWTVYTSLRNSFRKHWVLFQKVTCDEGKFHFVC